MEVSLEKILGRGFNIIDIRDFNSFNKGHIEGAVNISYSDLIINPSRYLSIHDIYYVYCQRGVKSLECSRILNGLGYKVYSISGGYDAYTIK